MPFQSALGFAVPLAVAIAALGSAIGLGRMGAAAMEAIGRQPEAASKIQLAMIIGFAFVEALTIYALVTMFILQGKIS
ncbi:MAG: ATP synthase F0 subunit C [Candidatus Eisenbacteria bacterium]|nr:ATP synthase F0 subunit C [Candidatus Eisenbacteria bacterium]